MPISFFYDKSVSIKRLKDTQGTEDRESYQDYLSDVTCMIQPLEEGFSEDLEGVYGQNFLMFCNVQNIKIKDKVIDGAIEYIVIGKEQYSFAGNKHLELVIRKTE